MAKKNAKKSAAVVEAPEIDKQLLDLAEHLVNIDIPGDLQERFAPQIERTMNRLVKIAVNLRKAIELGTTKAERDAKKQERIAKRQKKLQGQLEATQAKLDALKE